MRTERAQLSSVHVVDRLMANTHVVDELDRVGGAETRNEGVEALCDENEELTSKKCPLQQSSLCTCTLQSCISCINYESQWVDLGDVPSIGCT